MLRLAGVGGWFDKIKMWTDGPAAFWERRAENDDGLESSTSCA